MSRPFALGLTGSIGMGKSTAGQMFVEADCALWDADTAVHRLYAPGGAAVAPIAALHSPAVAGGAVSRDALKRWMADDPEALAAIEAVVHPLVAADRASFLATTDADIAVCDVPLLFETQAERAFDAVAVVSAPAEVQRARVLARPGMTEAHFEAILSRQMPDAEKRRRADYIIPSQDMDAARAAVQDVVRDIRSRHA